MSPPESDSNPNASSETNTAQAVLARTTDSGWSVSIPDHTLIRRIGRGSYGEVWIARSVLDVYRAVKIIDRRAFDDDRPFEREFAGIQRFEPVSRTHESQLNILHVGRAPNYFYYVMELADDMGNGANIDEASYCPRTLRSELLVRGRLPVDECIRLGLALSTALEHLHRHGLVHRDIKPSNIVFVHGIPKLADIGLVARAEATMSFVGTEGYLPPEGPGTVQADLFSLGKVLYELSTGRDRQQFPELPTNITELPDRAALAELNEVLLRACAPDVRQRYESAADLHLDLALLQSGKSVARMRAVERRLKLVARGAILVTAFAVLLGLAYFYQRQQTAEARRLGNENRALSEQNRERVVRSDIANGTRQMDQADYSAALLWFAEALPQVADRTNEARIHRIRIQQVLNRMPQLLRVIPEDGNIGGGFSPDGKWAVISTGGGRVRCRDTQTGLDRFPPLELGSTVMQARFTRDGQRLLLAAPPSGGQVLLRETYSGIVRVLEATTGRESIPLSRIFPGTATNLFYSTFSSDDSWLAVVMPNNRIRILDTQTGQVTVELTGHTDEIRMLTFSADGTLLASTSRDGTARLWRVPSGEPLGTPLQHTGPVRRVAFSPNGLRVATATDPATNRLECVIQTWDVATGRTVGPPIEQVTLGFVLAYDAQTGRQLITGDGTFMVHVRDAETHQDLFPPLAMESTARCVAFSPGGHEIAIGSDDGTARVWNLDSGELKYPPFRHTGWVESVQFSPDGTRLLTISDDGSSKIWRLKPPPQPAQLRFPAEIVGGTKGFRESWGRDPGPLVIQLTDGSFSLIDSTTVKEAHHLMPTETNLPPWRCAVAPSGRAWAVYSVAEAGHVPRVVDLWSEEAGTLRHLALPHAEMAFPVLFNQDGSRVVSGCTDRQIRVWRTADGVLEKTIPLQSDQARVWSFLPDPRQALIKKKTGEFEIFDLELLKTITVLQTNGLNYAPRRIIDPAGRQLGFIQSQKRRGEVVDLTSGKPRFPRFKHGGTLVTLDFSPDGRRLLTAGLGDAKLWDATTGELLQSFRTDLKSTRLACWSSDGRLIATRSDSNAARVWDAATGEAVTPIFRHSDYIDWVGIVGEYRLFTASAPNLLQAWSLEPTAWPADVLTDYAKLMAGRRINSTGLLLPLKADEINRLHESLLLRAPALFDGAVN